MCREFDFKRWPPHERDLAFIGISSLFQTIYLSSSERCCHVLKLLLFFVQLQPLTPLVDEFASRLFGELDYVQEGLNAEKFQVSQAGCPLLSF